MRALIKPTVFAVLAFAAASCFLAAALSAVASSKRSSAVSAWTVGQPPALPVRVAEQIIDLSPATLEEELEAEPELPVAPLVKKLRRSAVARPVAPVPTSTAVEPQDAIRIALRSKRASFEHCYEQELKKQASFSGFIVVALSLSAAGKVTEARVQEGSRRDAVVGACIVAQLRTLKLPPLTSEADLLIPIRLQAREPT